jgi:hypothetical protein
MPFTLSERHFFAEIKSGHGALQKEHLGFLLLSANS